MKIEKPWQRIAKWYAENTPEGTLQLPKGATKKRLAAFEKRIGFPLLPDMRESYQLHDGTTGGTGLPVDGKGFMQDLMSLDEIEGKMAEYYYIQKHGGFAGPDWETLNIKGPIKPIWWSSLRIPITTGSDPMMVDFDPPKGGTKGQIISYDHEVGPECVLAPSFSIWLNDVADCLESGKIRYDKKRCDLVSRRLRG